MNRVQLDDAIELLNTLLNLYDKDGLDNISYEELAEEDGLSSIQGVKVLQREYSWEHFHVVFTWRDKTYKWVGGYYSHCGVEIDPYDLFEVTPQQKMVTVYV